MINPVFIWPFPGEELWNNNWLGNFWVLRHGANCSLFYLPFCQLCHLKQMIISLINEQASSTCSEAYVTTQVLLCYSLMLWLRHFNILMWSLFDTHVKSYKKAGKIVLLTYLPARQPYMGDSVLWLIVCTPYELLVQWILVMIDDNWGMCVSKVILCTLQRSRVMLLH